MWHGMRLMCISINLLLFVTSTTTWVGKYRASVFPVDDSNATLPASLNNLPRAAVASSVNNTAKQIVFRTKQHITRRTCQQQERERRST